MNDRLIFSNDAGHRIDDVLLAAGATKAIILADANTASLAVPTLRRHSQYLADAPMITVPVGENCKHLDTLARVWSGLAANGATRSSFLVNVGGGAVTDLGGFAAATFKRGMHFVNVPTTVLGAVDASYGGKTGINFEGVKNMIGAFAMADATIVSDIFFNTLPRREVLSGYAEMIKHGLLQGGDVLSRLMAYSPLCPQPRSGRLLDLIEESSQVKIRVVDMDPFEIGLRKILNLGHTAGHAFESMAARRGEPLEHGYAVAAGLIVALVLSHLEIGFPSATLYQVASYIRDNYGAFAMDCKDYPALIALMQSDKKNTTADAIAFTLLKDVGHPVTGHIVAKEQITGALDIYRDLTGQ